MPNIIRINWSMESISLTLFNVIRQNTEAPKYYEIEHVENKLLGMKPFNCEFIQYVLEKSKGGRDEVRSTQVEKYFNTGELGVLTQLEEVISKDYTKMLNEAITCEIEGKAFDISYNTYVEDVIKKTGLEQRVERLFERMKSNSLQYPIEYITIDKNISSNKWLTGFVKDTFKEILIKDEDTEVDIESISQQKSLKETSQLILKYKGEEVVLLNQEQMEKPQINVTAYFSLKFSLDIAIEVTIIEKWRQDGRSNVKEIARQRFYHPMFYTGEQMKLLISKDWGQYHFKLTHTETKMEMCF